MADQNTVGDEEFQKELAAENAAKPPVVTPPADEEKPPAADDAAAPPAADDKEDDEEVKVPIRKSVEQHIISRQKRTIEKLRSKDDDEDEPDDTPPPSDDDAPPPEDAVAREVKRQLAPVLSTLVGAADDAELSELYANEPESKKYAKRIRAYMEDPNWKAVPPSAIYHHLAFNAAAGVEDKKKKKEAADLEAGQARGGGSSHREAAPKGDLPSADDIDEMDEAEFEKLQHQARTGAFIK